MILKYSAEDPAGTAADCLVLCVTQYDKPVDPYLKRLDAGTRGGITRLRQTEEFFGKDGQYAVILSPEGFAAPQVVLVGVGERRVAGHDAYRRALGRIANLPALTRAESLAIHLGTATRADCFQAAAEGYLLGGWKQREFKSGEEAKDPRRTTRITFMVKGRAQLRPLQQAVERGWTIAEGQLLVRRLAGTPSNRLTPSLYAQEAAALARRHKIEVTVLDEAAIKKEKMGALLAVAQGSAQKPRFVVLRYHGGGRGQKPVVLVGKGATFDTGGISLKDPLNMHEMKGDMAGSAAVLAALVTAARLRLRINLVGLMPLAENMPSGTATRPGDIVTSRKGKTIEIINTDAEGRLLLADALDYANTFNPQAVIDIATLTGATLYILGYAGAPILGNHEGLLARIKAGSAATGERVWPLPIWDDMREQMKSPIADLTNSGGKPAGTIAAAAFLENFVGDWPWAHIDIAYVDVEPAGRPYVPKGPTGFGLRLLVDLLMRWKKLEGKKR